MTKVIIISGGNLDSFYEQTKHEMMEKYINNQPTSLNDRCLVNRQQDYYDTTVPTGRIMRKRKPIGKRIV